MSIQTRITRRSSYDSIQQQISSFSELPYRKYPYKSRNWGHMWHSLCSYPSKLKPSIAHFLIDYFSKPNEVILDPFSGVGTVPFEACLNGRVGIGIDLNPLAFHVTNAKVSIPPKKEIMDDFNNLKKWMENNEETTENVPEEICEFFHPKTLSEIVTARKFLLKEFDDNPRPSISFLIANIAHILHGNRPYALSRRSHNIIPIPPKGAFEYKPLLKHTRERIERYVKAKFPENIRLGNAYRQSVFDFEIENTGVDAIITSPPFLGNTEFLRQNRIRVWFCGWGYDKQNEMKDKFVDYMGLSIYDKLFKKFYKEIKDDGLCILHLGVVKKQDMGISILPYAEKNNFEKLGLVYEDTTHLETHGRTDRGGTHKHQFLILRKKVI